MIDFSTDRLRRRAALGVVLLAALSGCGRSDLPERAPVEGVVTLDGTPLTTGEVLFVPAHGPSASATIDANGGYTLTTDYSGGGGGGDGAIVGKHKVRVRSRTPHQAGELSRSLIPMKYGDESKSGLTAEVVSGQDNVVDLKLSSK